MDSQLPGVQGRNPDELNDIKDRNATGKRIVADDGQRDCGAGATSRPGPDGAGRPRTDPGTGLDYGSAIQGAAAVGVPVTNLSPQDFVRPAH